MTDSGFPYTFPFFFEDSFQKRVRAFVMVNLTEDDTTNPQVKFGAWQPTGASTYRCIISGHSLYFYIDGTLKDTINLQDLTLDQNVKFGRGYPHNFNALMLRMIDTAYKDKGDVGSIGDFPQISGSLWEYHIEDLAQGLKISHDSGSTWTSYPDRKLDVVLAWNYDYVTGRYKDSGSIQTYGPHFYKVSEPLITTRDDARTLARRYVETYKDGLKTGSVTIKGKTNISLSNKFRLYLPEVGINETLIIASYQQRIDKNGFTTRINYGTVPYDIAAKVARIERKLESEM